MPPKLKAKVTHKNVRLGFDTIAIIGTILLIVAGAFHFNG